MNTSFRGFIALPILLIGIGLLVAGGATYYMYSTNQSPIEVPDPVVSVDAEVEPAVSDSTSPSSITSPEPQKVEVQVNTEYVETQSVSQEPELSGERTLAEIQSQHKKVEADIASIRNRGRNEDDDGGTSLAACIDQKESLLPKAEKVYLSWASSKDDAKLDVINESCTDEESTEGRLKCENALSDFNVEWQNKITASMKIYQNQLTECPVNERRFGDISDVISSSY